MRSNTHLQQTIEALFGPARAGALSGGPIWIRPAAVRPLVLTDSESTLVMFHSYLRI